MTAASDVPADDSTNDGVARRRVLGGAAVVAAGAAALAACGSDNDSSSDSNSAGKPKSGGAAAPGALAATSSVPVGGGVVVDTAKTVVTQPTAGQFKAFSAVCTHQGCIVSDVTNGEIVCPCHGSRFSASDGSVRNGPAHTPLATKPIRVAGGQIMPG